MKNLCLKCPNILRDKCCYFSYHAFTNDGKKLNIVLTNQKCPFFDDKTHGCTVYKQRFIKNPYCEKIIKDVEKGGVIEGCAYLKKLKKHIKVEPKRIEIPEDIRIVDKKMIEYLDNIPQERFLEYFYPLLTKALI